MANILMFNQNIEVLSCKNGGKQEFLFFEDSTVKINAKVVYDNQQNIKEMIFNGNNKNQNKYVIKHVTFCDSNNFDWGDRFLIHIDNTATIPGDSIAFKIDKNYNANLINKLNFSKNSVSPFYFKEYLNSVPTDPNKLDCRMQMVTPKTKDGSIIVSI